RGPVGADTGGGGVEEERVGQALGVREVAARRSDRQHAVAELGGGRGGVGALAGAVRGGQGEGAGGGRPYAVVDDGVGAAPGAVRVLVRDLVGRHVVRVLARGRLLDDLGVLVA